LSKLVRALAHTSRTMLSGFIRRRGMPKKQFNTFANVQRAFEMQRIVAIQ
jgi:hypothetical protein